MSFAEKLKTVRKEKNITQEQLADILNVSRQAVSKWESGNGYPETEKLLLIAKELNVSLDYLMLDEALPEKDDDTENKITSAHCSNIAITAFDKESVIMCQSVKSSKIVAPGKNEPKYILLGIDKVTFWGEHTTILGWYETSEMIQQEIACITQAIKNGEKTYTLKYAADIEFVGIFGQAKLKK